MVWGVNSYPEFAQNRLGYLGSSLTMLSLVLGSQTFTPSAGLTSDNIQTNSFLVELRSNFLIATALYFPLLSPPQTKVFSWSWKWGTALDNLNPSGKCSLCLDGAFLTTLGELHAPSSSLCDEAVDLASGNDTRPVTAVKFFSLHLFIKWQRCGREADVC